MKNIFLYPYTPKLDSVIKIRDLLKTYHISSLGCYKEDYAYLQRRYPGLNITPIFEDGAVQADAIYFNPEVTEQDKVKKYLAYAEEKGIPRLQPSELYEPLEETAGYKMKKIEQPVIAVVGQGEECSKFETMGIVLSQIRKRGFRVLGITGNNHAPVLEVEKIPQYFFDENKDLAHKTVNFNRYLADLAKQLHPDIIVIDIPGGLFPVSDVEYYHFSELPLVISSAAEIDAAFMNLFYNNLDLDDEALLKFSEQIKMHCIYKYQIEISQFCISSNYLRINVEGRKAEILALGKETAEEYTRKHLGEQITFLENREAITAKVDELMDEMKVAAELI